MRVLRRRTRYAPPGSAPGTLNIDPEAHKPQLDVMMYGPEVDSSTVRRQPMARIAELPDLPAGHTVRWVNVVGLGDADVLREIGERFHLHPLTLADIANTSQRPKTEAYDDYLFLVTRMPSGSSEPEAENADANADDSPAESTYKALVTEQLSICVGRDFVLTFQETPEDVFEPVRHRLLNGGSLLRRRGADYLAYALLDAAIDAFFPLLEAYGEDVDGLESDVIENPVINQIGRIHDLKRNLLTARRAVWPQREMLSAMIREETPFIDRSTKVFLRDCYDHTIQLIDMIETYREIASGLVDIQLSSQSNRMNEIMKVLTIISTIFIPLSFIAGLYGMNFNTASPWNLPELKFRYGYPVVLCVMFTIASSLLLWFRSKGWIGGRNK